MREWLSGGAPPCQGGGRGFDPRLALLKTLDFSRVFLFHVAFHVASNYFLLYISSVNSKLNIYNGTTTVTLQNATGGIASYKVTNYFACCIMEITPTDLTHNTLLAWGLYAPDRELFLSLPTIGGGNIPCKLTTNGELRTYYPVYTSLERIDFTFMYPSKRL